MADESIKDSRPLACSASLYHVQSINLVTVSPARAPQKYIAFVIRPPGCLLDRPCKTRSAVSRTNSSTRDEGCDRTQVRGGTIYSRTILANQSPRLASTGYSMLSVSAHYSLSVFRTRPFDSMLDLPLRETCRKEHEEALHRLPTSCARDPFYEGCSLGSSISSIRILSRSIIESWKALGTYHHSPGTRLFYRKVGCLVRRS